MRDRVFVLSASATLLALTILFIALAAGLGPSLLSHPLGRLRSDEILYAIKLSIGMATAAAVLAVIVAVPVAYLLSRFGFPGKNLIEVILYLPITVSPVALGTALLLFFKTAPGRALERLLGGVVFEVSGILVAQFVVIVGLAVGLCKTAFDYIDPGYEDIARTLGEDRWGAFRRSVLPAAKKGLAAAFLLTWARAIGEFGATVTLAGATPMKTETLPVAIYLSLASADVQSAAALILIALAMSLLVLAGVKRVSA